MHVAIDLRLIGYAWGGTAQYGLQLATHLARAFPETRFSLLRSRRAPRELVRSRNVRERLMLTPPHHRWEQVLLPLELARVRVDLLHSTDYIPPFRRRVPAVATIGDLGFLRFPETVTPESAVYYGQTGRAAHSAEHVLTYSESSAEDIRNMLDVPSARVTVTPLGADPMFQPVADPRPVLERHGLGGPYILFVSTLEPRKNLSTLLRAFSTLRDRQPEVTLAVVGRRGWLDQPIFDLVDELELEASVLFLGSVPAEDLPALYSGASVFAFPSLHEGFGLPVLEAMACGCPVICSNASSLPEVAGDAAVLLPPTDVARWAATLGEVLGDAGTRAQLAALGRARAAQFDWHKTAILTHEVYARVAGA